MLAFPILYKFVVLQKPTPEGKDLPTTLAKHRENCQSCIDLVKKGHVILNNPFSFNTVYGYDCFSSNTVDNYWRPKNKIPAFPAKAGEKPMVFQLFEPNSEKDHFPAFPFFPAGVDNLVRKH